MWIVAAMVAALVWCMWIIAAEGTQSEQDVRTP